MATTAVSACREDELPTLLAALDDEFVFSKGRSVGLARRFPGLFEAGNLANVLVAREAGRVVAAAAAKPFTYVELGRRWACASVGAVWTHREFRGRGLASAVMQALKDAQARAGTEALVLWTSIHPFYEALGWALDDVGLFGSALGVVGPVEIAPRALSEVDLERLEALRREHGAAQVSRSAGAWAAVPLPATRVDCYLTDGGYALVGAGPDAGYVYELFGGTPQLEALWRSVRARGTKLFVNGRPGLRHPSRTVEPS